MSHSSGPWFVSGVRFRMNGCEWHSINRYDDIKKKDETIACVGFDPRTGLGFADAKLIAMAPEMLEAIRMRKRARNVGIINDTEDLWSKAEELEDAILERFGL